MSREGASELNVKRLNDSLLLPGDLVLTTTTATVSAAIRAATRSDISHAMVYVEDRSIPSGSAAPVPDYGRDHAFPRSRTDQAAAREAQRWRAVRHAQVQRRRAAGESIMAIARAIPLAPATVRRYASMDRPPERGERRIGSSQLDPWLAYLERRRAEGCENGSQLCESCANAVTRAARGRSTNGCRVDGRRSRSPRRDASYAGF